MTVVAQTAGVRLRPTAWADAVTLQRVDPALGIQSLVLSLTGTIASTIAISNLDLAPAVFDSTTTGTVVLSRPDGTAWLSAGPDALAHGIFLAFTGMGAVPVQLSGQGSATSSVGYIPAQTGSADAALLVGTGQVTLPIAASARVHAVGPANMIVRFTASAGADVSLKAATSTAPGNSPTGVVIDPVTVPSVPPLFPAGSTKSQTIAAADASIGAVSALNFDGFDPALGVLDYVTVSVAADASGSVRLENLDPVAATATVSHYATVNLDRLDGTPLASSTASFSNTRQLAAFDGTDDLSGASAAAISEDAPIGSVASPGATIWGAGLGTFEAGPVALNLARTGTTTFDGPGNLDAATAL